MKRANFTWLFFTLFILWIFFVLGSFFTVQKPFSAGDVALLAGRFTPFRPLDLIAVAGLGLGLGMVRRRFPRGLTATLICWLLFLGGSLLLIYRPFSPTGLQALGNVLLNLAAASWLILIAVGLGRWLLAWLNLELSFDERFVFGAGLGLGALGLLSFGLGLLGLFQPVVIYGVTTLLTFLTAPQLIQFLREARSHRFSNPSNLLTALYLLLLAILTLPVALLPPTDWDGLFYHLTGPKLYLQAGGIVGGFDIPHLSFPGLMEMLFAWAMLLRGDIAAKLLHTVFVFLLAGLVYLTTGRLLGKKVAWPAVLILASMPMLITLAGWAYNDLALAFYQLGAMYAVVKGGLGDWEIGRLGDWEIGRLGEEETGRPETGDRGPGRERLKIPNPKSQIPNLKWIGLAGAFAGLAMGLKYTSFVTPLVIAGLLLWWGSKAQGSGGAALPGGFAREQGSRGAEAQPFQEASRGSRGVGEHSWPMQYAIRNTQYAPRFTPHASLLTPHFSLLIFSLTACLVAAPWYLKNWAFTGNPVYPFLYGLFGGQGWDQFRAAWYAAAGTGIGFEPGTLLALPWLLTLGVRDVNYWDGRTGPLLLLFLPLILLYTFSHHASRLTRHSSLITHHSHLPPAFNLLLLYALAHFLIWTAGVIWSRSLWQSRLLLPGLVGLAPLVGWVWRDLARFDLPNFSLSRFINLAIGLTLALTLVDAGLLALKIDPLPYLVGQEPRAAYLTRALGAHYAAMARINETLPPTAQIVFLWEPRSYYCRLDCRPDSILERFPHLVYRYGSAQAIARAWRDQGVTHVLINQAGLQFMLNESPAAIDQAVLAELRENYLKKISEVAGAYEIYEVLLQTEP